MPSRGMSNTACTYNSQSITAYCNQADLQAAINQLEVTNFASTAKEFLTEPSEWTIRVQGFWDALILDATLAVDAVTPGTYRNATIAFTSGVTVVTYTWTAKALLANWQVTSTATGLINFSAELRLSGAPVRSVA